MKFPLKTILYVVCGAAIGAGGFYCGRVSAPAAEKAATTKHTIASGAMHRPAGSAFAADQATLDDFLKAKGKPDAAKLAEWAKSLSPADCAAYLALLQKSPPGLQRDTVLAAIIGSWAAQDPQGFLTQSKGITGPQMREQGTDAALKAWAAQNPQQALQWLKDNPGNAPTSALNARYVAAIAGYASADPQGAFAVVSALGESTLADQRVKSQAMQAIVGSLTADGKFTDATTMLAQLPDGSNVKNQAYASLASSWAQANPQDASAWVSSLTDPQMRTNLGGQVAAQWAATDPAAAAAWAAQMDAQASANGQINNGNGTTNYLLADAMRTWSAYDLEGPANYLNELPASPDKDGAVATFALYAAQEDPAGAMNWVNTISDEQMRQRLAMVTALEWSQSDPNGYGQFMATSNVLTDQQKQLLNSLPPTIGQYLSGGFGGGRGTNAGNPGGGLPPRVQSYIINGNFGGAVGGAFGGAFGGNPGGGAQPAGNATQANPVNGPRINYTQRGNPRNGG